MERWLENLELQTDAVKFVKFMRTRPRVFCDEDSFGYYNMRYFKYRGEIFSLGLTSTIPKPEGSHRFY